MDLDSILAFARSHIMVFAAVVAAIILVIIVDFIMTKSEKDRAKKYVAVLDAAYIESSDVIASLEKTKNAFPIKSDQAKAITKAIYYINKSIMHDYKTAFYMIEDVVRGKQVQDLHDKILKQEKDKKKSILLLQAPKD